MRCELCTGVKGINFHLALIGEVSIFFSYETPVAFSAPVTGYKWVVRENDWGATTGRYLNEIDTGSKEAKAARLPSTEFERRLDIVLQPLED